MSAVIDANVVIKWYVAESDSAEARQVLASRGPLLAPAHILGEIGEVLIRRARAGEITREQLMQAAETIPERVRFIPLPELMEEAVSVAMEAKVSFYDALYVAAALRREVKLVTADEGLGERIGASRWNGCVLLLVDWQAHHRGH